MYSDEYLNASSHCYALSLRKIKDHKISKILTEVFVPQAAILIPS